MLVFLNFTFGLFTELAILLELWELGSYQYDDFEKFDCLWKAPKKELPIIRVPKAPILPGKSDVFIVRFDSTNKSENQTKRLTITTNLEPAQLYWTYKGEVEK